MEILSKNFDLVVKSYHQHPSFSKTLTILGGLQLLSISLRFLSTFWTFFHPPSRYLKKFQGKWAVVTGATWGIGYGFARELARRKLNVVLIARSQQRLEEVSAELKREFQVETKIIVGDFGGDRSFVYDVIANEIKDLEIEVLVNNVGIAPGTLWFDEIPREEIDRVVEVNIHSLNRMTSLILPQMKKRRSGVIINMSSLSSMIPFPLQSVYSGTKAYINQFSSSLAMECEVYGIKVLCVAPSFVTSKLTRLRKSSFFVCTESYLANKALNEIGYTRLTNPYIPHALIHWFWDIAKKFPLIEKMYLKSMLDTRKRTLEKKKKTEDETN